MILVGRTKCYGLETTTQERWARTAEEMSSRLGVGAAAKPRAGYEYIAGGKTVVVQRHKPRNEFISASDFSAVHD